MSNDELAGSLIWELPINPADALQSENIFIFILPYFLILSFLRWNSSDLGFGSDSSLDIQAPVINSTETDPGKNIILVPIELSYVNNLMINFYRMS